MYNRLKKKQVFMWLLESFIYIFLLSMHQNVKKNNYKLTCKSWCKQLQREIELGQVDLFKNCSSGVKLSITFNCYRCGSIERSMHSNTKEASLWMSSEVTSEHQLFFYTCLRPRVWSSSDHWWWCLTVNISYVCLLALRVNVVQDEASLSWCTRSHKSE